MIKLQYGSDGIFDFLGDLNPLNNLKDVIIALVGTPEQRANAAARKEEAKQLGLRNAEEAAAVMRRQGLPEHIVQATFNKAMRKLGYKIPKYADEGKIPRLPEIAAPPPVPRLPPPKPAS
ncbi:hypothetical protein IVB40_13510 [Bradyrhizobium sp. 40]|uniref:hypothetical protein n=1 Tax=Bradyrhizobium sp. 40 TaxID=2782674 RepID=UPI001FFECC45|nr:hypothetical protein [Bradyrhizobium sp. 40]UPJ44960.1 hypothetical protein IVB40_13510 [Bradyrhizobium sp. 40]